MTVPPPYDPVLLREHAYHDTGLTSLVITPGTNDGSFHAVAEKGLGLFSYRFADHYTIEKAVHTFGVVRLLNFLLSLALITAVYFAVDCIYEKLTSKLLESSTTMESVQERLLFPFTVKKSSTIVKDIESSPETFHSPLFEASHLHTPVAYSVPQLSSSVTNTPTSPDLYDNFEDHRIYDKAMLLNFIEEDGINYSKSQKIH